MAPYFWADALVKGRVRANGNRQKRDVNVVFLELGFDVRARVSAFEERLYAGVGQDSLEGGAILCNELNKGVLTVIAQHERKAENSSVCARRCGRFEVGRQGRVHGTNWIIE